MTTEVLYRKWRPQTFAEVAGQEAITRTLINAVAAGKVAHAYLFSGPRGTGKTTTGRLLAKAVNCLEPAEERRGEPCNRCESCRAYIEGRALDLIELDAASNRGIDEIRSLRDKVGFAPTTGRYKLYLVDEVHMLTEPAFNALLKTLEEPPPHVIFVLATTEVHKVPATIASRCQRFDFRRVPLEAIVERLEYICTQEDVECPREGLDLLARQATGSLRDAINLLEQLMDYQGRRLTLEEVRAGLGLAGDERASALARHAVRRELAQGLAVIASIRDDGLDLRQFQREVVSHLRSLLLTRAGADSTLGLTAEQAQELRSVAAEVAPEQVIRALKAFGAADLRTDPQSPLPLELALAECSLPPKADSPLATEPAAPAEGLRAAFPRAPERPAAAKSRIAALAEDEVPAPSREVGPPPETTPPSAESEPSPPPDVESRPSEEPAAVAEAPVGAPTSPAVEAARARWDEIYALTRQLRFQAGALLNSGCDIIGEEDGALVFGFRFPALVERMNNGEGGANLKALQDAVSRVFGKECKVRCVLAPQVEPRRPASSRGGHLVEAARQMGARVLPRQAGPDTDES